MHPRPGRYTCIGLVESRETMPRLMPMTHQRHLENSETLADGGDPPRTIPGLHGDVTLLPGVTSSLYGELELVVMMRGKEIASKRSSMWSSPSSPFWFQDSTWSAERIHTQFTYVRPSLSFLFFFILDFLDLSINEIIDNYSKVAKGLFDCLLKNYHIKFIF